MRKPKMRIASIALVTMAALVGTGCHSGKADPADTTAGGGPEESMHLLTGTDIDRVLGFEATTISDWSIIQSGPGTLAVWTTASQGSRALAVASHGYVPVQSAALSSLGSRLGEGIHYDIMLPAQLRQVSPYWYGTTQLFLNSPSMGLYNAFLGQLELTSLSVGTWTTLTFTLPVDIRAKLNESYTDLRATIVINAPYNATQPYLLDNLRFSDSTPALVKVVDGSGQPLAGLTVVAYNGVAPTSSMAVTDSTGLAIVRVPPGSYRFGVTDSGVTTYSSTSNDCQVPGLCTTVTITNKCHNVVCQARDTCHNPGTCDAVTGGCSVDLPKPAGTECRPAAGPCDQAETCNGTDAGCPPDGFLQASLLCRPAGSLCDAAEVCSGTSADCPADAYLSASTICRASTGPCDPAEVCSGTEPNCPPDFIATPPPPPTGLSATASSTGVTLTWDASPGANSYNVKRSTTSSGPFTTIASTSSSPYTNTGLGSGTTFYYAVTAVNSCGESGYQGLSYTPYLPKQLPAPPAQNGCHIWTLDGWYAVPCADEQWMIDHPGNPDVSRDGLNTVPPAGASPISFVYGQVETTLIHVGSVFDTGSVRGTVENSWSAQLNTQAFSCSGSHRCMVQFVLSHDPRSSGSNDATMCVWQIINTGPGGSPSYGRQCLGTHKARPGGFRDFDFVNIVGYTFTDTSTVPPTPKLGIVVQYSMIPDGIATDVAGVNQTPGLYAVTVDDQYGLAGNWTYVTGGIMGRGAGSAASFHDAEVMTVVSASNCPGDTTPGDPTCPSLPALTGSNSRYVSIPGGEVGRPIGYTTETNNLVLARDPVVSYPNANLVVTSMFSSTNVPAGNPPPAPGSTGAACLAGEQYHVFIKDAVGDNGGTPSSSGYGTWWESPDIFLLPAGAPRPGVNDVAAYSTATQGQPYELYLRVNNDYGCVDVGQIKVLIETADFLEMGFANWTGVTSGAGSGHYQDVPGASVPKHGKLVVGPFAWNPTSGSLDRCLLAAIAAGTQPPPAFPLTDAFRSNQIAQRNLKVSNGSQCDYVINNYLVSNAHLLIGATVSPAKSIPGSTVVKLTFDDNANNDWYTAWTAQANRLAPGTLSVASAADHKTVVTLGTSVIALDPVILAAQGAPHVKIDITSSASPPPSVALSAWISDDNGNILTTNGGSCLYSASPTSATTQCPAGQTPCSGTCVNLSTDPANCGACGYMCSGDCANGVCVSQPA